MSSFVKVTRENFKNKFDDITRDIDRASFVAIDCEFSGLLKDHTNPRCFNDDRETYYKKSAHHVKDLQILQIGLTMAIYDTVLNTYKSITYSFSLWPGRYFNNFPFITLENDAIKFLMENNFNFTQCFTNGISFMNSYQYHRYRNLLSLFKQKPQEVINIYRTYKLNDTYRLIKASLDDWLSQTSNENPYTIVPTYNDEFYLTGLLMNLLFDYRNKAYPIFQGDSISMVKSSSDMFQDNQTHLQLNILLSSVYGFSQIIEYLIKKKSILVGHNFFLDLMFIYDKFIAPLPATANEYKQELHKLFPTIFDTKTIIKYEKRTDPFFLQLYNTSLMSCFSFFQVKYDDSAVNFPVLPLSPSMNQPHDAGFDSYATSIGIYFDV